MPSTITIMLELSVDEAQALAVLCSRLTPGVLAGLTHGAADHVVIVARWGVVTQRIAGLLGAAGYPHPRTGGPPQ